MSLLPNLTFTSPGNPLYGAAGGGSSGPNPTFSTITLEGSNAITATLPSAPNDGFEVRNGGGGQNVVVVTTIDEDNAAQAEMGIRTLSTIAGNTSNVGRFEMTMDGLPSDVAALTYTLDKAVSGSASTIGAMTFSPGNGSNTAGKVSIVSENGGGGGASLTIGNYQVQGNSLACLNPRIATPTTNVYVPAAGTTQTVASFSTIASHVYEVFIPNIRVQNQPAGAPALGAWSQIGMDVGAGAFDTFDMASVSTIQNDYNGSRNYCFQATGAGHNLQCLGSLSNTLSTAFTFSTYCYIRDLGAPINMLATSNAP